jgi:purine nucleosidase
MNRTSRYCRYDRKPKKTNMPGASPALPVPGVLLNRTFRCGRVSILLLGLLGPLASFAACLPRQAGSASARGEPAAADRPTTAGKPATSGRRKVIIDQDAAGPGGTDMQAILTLVNSPETEVLGITVLTGDAWRDEEVAHTLRLLEIVGRTDIPVLPGAVFPLVSSKEYIAKWEALYGKVVYQGAWNFARGHAVHGPYEIPPLPEGAPTTKASTESGANFLVRMVNQFPHEVTIYAAGPMTNLALAIALDPHFAELTKELIVMGGSIHPVTDDPEFAFTPRREFNFWMDPEASHTVLHAHWPRLVLTTVDISLKTRMEKSLIAEIAKGSAPSAQYVAKYAEANILWDELAAAAWLDPSIITQWEKLYMDVDVDHGASYGDTLAWAPGRQPGMGEQLVEVQKDLDKEKFYKELADLLSRATPNARFAPEKAN